MKIDLENILRFKYDLVQNHFMLSIQLTYFISVCLTRDSFHFQAQGICQTFLSEEISTCKTNFIKISDKMFVIKNTLFIFVPVINHVLLKQHHQPWQTKKKIN
jgi:hypothetical protein